MNKEGMTRREFMASSGLLVGSALLGNLSQTAQAAQAATGNALFNATGKKMRIALVGTGIRGITMWGKGLVQTYPDLMEFVGICDINEGRLKFAKGFMGVTCPIFTDFDEMMKTTHPEVLMVCTTDCTHHTFIIKGMEYGADIITEKPMTIDEQKVQAILDAEKRTGKKVRVTFNYRYSPHRAKMWELLRNGEIGELTSVDFHWYLNTGHGADYFRRWHRKIENSGSLLLHKACHHFDLLNWWIDSDPVRVYCNGALDFYGKNGTMRGETCRACSHKNDCKFFWDITRSDLLTKLYVDNYKYDHYNRDGCVFANDVNIYDKMAATIKYANGVQVAYSLTAYSPYEGYRIAFNGTGGRIDAWIEESNRRSDHNYDEIVLFKNFSKRQYFHIPFGTSGHGGGDALLKDQIFNPNVPDPMRQCANVRDGAMACLIGIAARKSIQTGNPVNIADLTSLKPEKVKQYNRV